MPNLTATFAQVHCSCKRLPRDFEITPATDSESGASAPAAAQLCRRSLLHVAAGAAWQISQQAAALTLEDVTPSVAPVGPLTDREAGIISVFESSAAAVVNVFDVTLMVSALSLTLDQLQ